MHRCYDETRHKYELYGGRGIKVAERWHDFALFLEDMGMCPGKGWSIDRIDNEKNYEPGNCRWATRKQQMRNTSQNKLITYKGETLCVVEWAERLGMKPSIIRDRIGKLNWPIELALSLGKLPKSPKEKRALIENALKNLHAGGAS